MRRSFLLSLVGHLVVGVLVIGLSWAFSRPRRAAYPRMMTATFVMRQPAVQAGRPEHRAKAPAVQPPAQSVRSREQTTHQRTERHRSTPASAAATGQNAPKATPQPAMKLDVPAFPFPEYLALIQYRIESQWQPPRNTGGGLLTTVYFKIHPDGTLTDIKITRTCGRFAVDQAALRAVYSANPLPPLPPASGLPSLGVHFDFVVY